MRNKYNVIIIGAGPAGLQCAHQLKNSGLSVLLIEKNKIIGPKICAGGLTNLDKKFTIPSGKTRSFAAQIVFLEKRKYKLTLINPLKTIDRYDLGQHQLNKIKGCANITILKETFVRSIEKNKIITGQRDFYFKYLVGADGSFSILRRYLGLKSNTCMGLYNNVFQVTDDFVWYVSPSILQSGYIWEFPHKKYTNIGIYFNPKHLTFQQARDILIDYLKKKNYPFSSENFRGAPINYDYRGCVFGSFFLAGDAAGLASKTTGEGISFALTSGKEVGKKILNPDYKMIELGKILTFKKRQERMLRVFEKFSYLQKHFFKIFISLMQKPWFQSYFGN